MGRARTPSLDRLGTAPGELGVVEPRKLSPSELAGRDLLSALWRVGNYR